MAELLKQVQYLKDNGFTEQQANTLIYFHKDRVESDLASKKDILLLQKEIEGVRKEIEALRAETKRDIEGIKKDIIIQLGSVVVAGMTILGFLISIF